MAAVSQSLERTWWKEAVVYQIYPRSFNDTDGDGVGDLPGIHEKLDYLDELGVDVVWLNPVYDSPQTDNGYDVRDYRKIHPEFGTMADWEALRDGFHERDIRLLMDLVVNHTSDEHDWFQQSRCEEDKYAEYYHWRQGDPDTPPNNWTSFFGGPAWSYDDEREAWYLHLFGEKQPDLNWENPDVREGMYNMMRWWLEKEIDGFRLNVINLISKPEGLPDGDPDAERVGQEHYLSGPRVHEYVQEMSDRVLSDYDIMTVGEISGATLEDARRFSEDGLDMIFGFDHLNIDRGQEGPWDIAKWNLSDLREATTRWQTGLDEGWNSIFLGNHDQPRLLSRFGDDERYRTESAKMLATFMFTLHGTPFVLQGDEIGMTNVPFRDLQEIEDPDTLRRVNIEMESGSIPHFESVQEGVNYWTRDNARTPMQWADTEHAGFTDGNPWLKINPNHSTINVEHERTDTDTILSYYRQLIDLRHDHPVMVYGEYEPLHEDHADIYAYLRTLDDAGQLLVILNFFDDSPTFELPDAVTYDTADLLIANYDVDREDPHLFDLQPYEARVYRLS